MNQISILHLTPQTGSVQVHHNGSVQVQDNKTILLDMFGLKGQLYAWKNVLITNDLQETPNLKSLVSVKSCPLLARQNANSPSTPYHTYHTTWITASLMCHCHNFHFKAHI